MATVINSTNLNRFHNLSPAMLADLIGDLDRKEKAATAVLDTAKDTFKARGLLIAERAAFSVMTQKSIRQTLDNAKVKSAMGQCRFDDNCRLTEVLTLRIAATASQAIAA